MQLIVHKYDAMRKDWHAWKHLRTTETGLGWDPISGKIKTSAEWWDKKIKENQYVKKFRGKGVSSLLEEKWEYIYGVLANEEQFFTNFFKCVSNGNDDKTKANSEDGPSQVDNQLLIIQVASQAGTDRELSRRAPKSVLKTNNVQLKCNRSQSGGSTMLGAQIKQMVASCRIMSQGAPNRMNKQASSMSTIAMLTQIINRMRKAVTFEVMLLVLEDAVKREIFLNMDDDDRRPKWLQYLHRMKDY
ncbi:LOW QUALITY PROTEIN: hypothetical protein Cgig2_011575 [Carnegiea gigantea]|uniref:Myb/SANT-like domain-containing protein n=1 Tax=Carnegiea gigantea TaxID=171969 RepID=A0A9Q1K8B5_9CARY|nr:LOW QUALITY PROTEIN: hypothetical protein Cgig2_011575 [Carnegiea gigantea]